MRLAALSHRSRCTRLGVPDLEGENWDECHDRVPVGLLTFQSIAIGHRFEFHANGVGNGDDWTSFEREGGKHRTELMHFERVVTFHQHISTPIADADDECLDFEIGWRLPWAEDLEDSLLCLFVLCGEPCGRSFQVIMYFMIVLLFRNW